jgi:hypothetical protein
MRYPDLFYGFETFFNTMFFFELLVNMYAFWCCRFWKSGWELSGALSSQLALFYDNESYSIMFS